MGIIDTLLGRSPLGTGLTLGVTGLPWQGEQGSLAPVVFSDLFGADVLENLPMTRAEAITIPAVSKARNLIVATVAKWPLYAMTGADRSSTQPTFLYRTNGKQSPYTRNVWTLDDAIMYGCSLWLLERGADNVILDAERVPFDWWRFAQDDSGEWRIMLRENGVGKERALTDTEACLFDFPFEGLLNIARRTLRGAVSQERSWVGRSTNPVPVINLALTDDVQLDEAEVKAMVQAWADARKSPNGAVGSTPAGVELQTFGEIATDLMIEGRNAVRTDVGSFLNIRASMLDGTIGIDSLTYSTTEGEKNSFFEIDLPFWTDPFESRLSMDDIVPRGQRVRFEKYQAAPSVTGPEVED